MPIIKFKTNELILLLLFYVSSFSLVYCLRSYNVKVRVTEDFALLEDNPPIYYVGKVFIEF